MASDSEELAALLNERVRVGRLLDASEDEAQAATARSDMVGIDAKIAAILSMDANAALSIGGALMNAPMFAMVALSSAPAPDTWGRSTAAMAPADKAAVNGEKQSTVRQALRPPHAGDQWNPKALQGMKTFPLR